MKLAWVDLTYKMRRYRIKHLRAQADKMEAEYAGRDDAAAQFARLAAASWRFTADILEATLSKKHLADG